MMDFQLIQELDTSYANTASWCHISLLHWNEIACFEFPHAKMTSFAFIYLTDTLIQSDLQAQPDLIQTGCCLLKKKTNKQKTPTSVRLLIS